MNETFRPYLPQRNQIEITYKDIWSIEDYIECVKQYVDNPDYSNAFRLLCCLQSYIFSNNNDLYRISKKYYETYLCNESLLFENKKEASYIVLDVVKAFSDNPVLLPLYYLFSAQIQFILGNLDESLANYSTLLKHEIIKKGPFLSFYNSKEQNRFSSLWEIEPDYQDAITLAAIVHNIRLIYQLKNDKINDHQLEQSYSYVHHYLNNTLLTYTILRFKFFIGKKNIEELKQYFEGIWGYSYSWRYSEYNEENTDKPIDTLTDELFNKINGIYQSNKKLLQDINDESTFIYKNIYNNKSILPPNPNAIKNYLRANSGSYDVLNLYDVHGRNDFTGLYFYKFLGEIENKENSVLVGKMRVLDFAYDTSTSKDQNSILEKDKVQQTLLSLLSKIHFSNNDIEELKEIYTILKEIFHYIFPLAHTDVIEQIIEISKEEFKDNPDEFLSSTNTFLGNYIDELFVKEYVKALFLIKDNSFTQEDINFLQSIFDRSPDFFLNTVYNDSNEYVFLEVSPFIRDIIYTDERLFLSDIIVPSLAELSFWLLKNISQLCLKNAAPFNMKKYELYMHLQAAYINLYDKLKKTEIDTFSLEQIAEVPTAFAADSIGQKSIACINPSYGSLIDELNALVGLEDIKTDVQNMISLVQMQKIRKDKGLKTVPVSLHLVFTGNPGTGKTTVARILAKLYKEIGVLKNGQLIEVDRSGLVAGYVGQTALKTQEKINQAMGGVLFIDEAYSLVKEGQEDFGQEAIDTILKAMEDHRDEFVVIVAGYDEPMSKFINSNPGLKSRFNKYFHFPDYTADEMIEIFCKFCKQYDYQLTEGADYAVQERIREMEQNKGQHFANARDVRNYFESIITRQASRVGMMSNPSEEDVTTITFDDVN